MTLSELTIRQIRDMGPEELAKFIRHRLKEALAAAEAVDVEYDSGAALRLDAAIEEYLAVVGLLASDL